MCGIAGVLGDGARVPTLLPLMAATIEHRGPDDYGSWTDTDAAIGLAHRRLSIIDLSPAGHQPMASSDGRWVLSYNGEIYNHGALRKELEQMHGPIAWRGHSDTETLVEAIASWGLAQTLGRCVGMFALALWDRQERRLSLARDRFGEKPLYYGWVGRDFLFGSELKALRAHHNFDNAISRRAVAVFAGRTYIPAPLSIYEHVYKLEPGCILVASIDAGKIRPNDAPRAGKSSPTLSIDRYWSYRNVVMAGLDFPIIDEAEAISELERTLSTAIGGQSLADVPVGAFLSGGIDSSTIVALYQKYSSTKVRTFSMGFQQAGYNEAEYAKAVAAHFGTIHQERYVSVDDAREIIPALPAMYDEPFGDSSQIPTHLVSRFAREQVTVALSGDGGDELFAGYNRHFSAPRLWQRLQRVPLPLRSIMAATLGRLPSATWDRAATMLGRDVQQHFGTKVRKAMAIGGMAHSFDEVYDTFLDEWAFEKSPVLRERGCIDTDIATAPLPNVPDAVRTMYRDALTYLPDDILCKVDRAAMAVSLETRVPFLDHRVAELAARIPLSMKLTAGGGKGILRKVLYREAPAELFARPKAGFGVPVGEWIKGPLRPWAEDLLKAQKLEGWFDPQIVHRRWADHLSGKQDSTPAIWSILMFQSWRQNQAA